MLYLCINRNFMELKREIIMSCFVFKCGINRTFMELKLRRESWRIIWRLYQSNLYGIETGLRSVAAISGVIVSIEPLWNWNGIKRPPHGKLHYVSIEPLWNWNRSLIFFLFFAFLYQSNLYGIETTVRICPLQGHLRINRTFMELKLGLQDSVLVHLAYQSNLYGIETCL